MKYVRKLLHMVNQSVMMPKCSITRENLSSFLLNFQIAKIPDGLDVNEPDIWTMQQTNLKLYYIS